MHIEILYVPGCPQLGTARARLRDALEGAGATASVEEIEVSSAEDAARVGMRGSPTILIDGRDAVGAGADPSVSCRLYRTADGTDGAPTVAQLTAALSS